MDVVQVLQTLASAITRLLLDPGSRTFWPFLAAGIGLSAAAAFEARRAALLPHEKLMSRATWLSDSAMMDYGIILINALLFAFALQSLKPDIGAASAWVQQGFGGTIALAPASAWWVPLAFAGALFLVDDFIRYIIHYSEHRIPALWELHKVHHSADVLNFMTAERHHPLSTLIFQIVGSFGVIAVNGLFIVLFPGQISMATLLGGNLFWIATNMIGGALRHSPVWISFGPRIERWLISPAQHQIHHSDNPRHFDCNFGGSLAIWDRMFGTLYTTTPERERINFGLGDETRAYNSLLGIYLRPLRRIAAMVRPRPVATAV
jgi:sterol desaturase/sphingolipid hydroxylase (fatty acid hydroxylase superfamily)